MSNRRSVHARRQASVDYPRYPPPNSQTQQPPISMLQAPPISDYESDNQGYTSDYPSKPPPPTRTIDELNLSVLQRHDPQIAAILSIAPYAVMYEFTPLPEPAWSKTGVEGTMFICQLMPGAFGEDRYSVIVLNRRGLGNFEAELREAEDGGVEVTDPYVIISFRKDGEQKIYGVFIFSEGSGTSTEQVRAANAELMKTLAVSAGSSRMAAEAAATAMKILESKARESEVVAQKNLDSGNAANLLALFGQTNKKDANFSTRTHQHGDTLGSNTQPPLQTPSSSYLGQTNSQVGQQDVLGDLFRRAGLK